MGIVQHFEKIGAVLEAKKRKVRNDNGYTIDVKDDTFIIDYDPKADLTFQIMQVLPTERHLLLMARHPISRENEKYLCGHDEREFFVSQVPADCTDVRTAIERIRPARVGGKRGEHFKRKTKDYIRQGEWFFIHEPMEVNTDVILYNEAIRMGAGKPHICAELVRSGGSTVFTCPQYPDGVSPTTRMSLNEKNTGAPYAWTAVRANAAVWARGTVRHPDHKTIHLKTWHRVEPNREIRSSSIRFLD